MTDLIERVPPHSELAEQSVLGAMFLDEQAVPIALGSLTADSFYFEKHRIIFKTMFALNKRKNPVDIISVRERLLRNKKLDKIGGSAYLSQLLNSVATSANMEYYSNTIKDNYQRREIIKASMSMIDSAYESEVKTLDLLSSTQSRITNLVGESMTGGDLVPLGEIIDDAFIEVESQLDGDDRMIGIPTGLENLDMLTRGFSPTELIIIAGRPGEGKSSLMATISLNMALLYNRHSAIFSMEMGKAQLAKRYLCSAARVNQRSLEDKYMTKVYHRLMDTADKLRDAKIYIDPSVSLNITQLHAKLLRQKQRLGLDICFIDYLQLMQSEDPKLNTNQQISNITRSLKMLAGELNIPIVCLSQLKRRDQKQKEREPVLSDLRDSGAIEQDADTVIFIHEEELLVRKQRDGACGNASVKFNPQYTLFENDGDFQVHHRRDLDD